MLASRRCCSPSARSCSGAAPRTADEEEAAEEEALASGPAATCTGWRVAATSFGVLFLAEWGDLSQLFTAGLAARYEDPVSVFVGSWLALVTVAGLAVLLGRTLLRFVASV